MRKKVKISLKMLVLWLLNVPFVSGFAQNEKSKPSIKFGLLLHTYVSSQQNGFGSSNYDDSYDSWNTNFNLYRARIMSETHLTDKDYVFLETELTTSLGSSSDKAASIKILDASYSHKFSDYFQLTAGKMLASYNRNGLQTANTLMVNDFTYYQYPYNMSKEGPLQNDVGRDIGVDLEGSVFKDKLCYRLGAFSGRRDFENEDNAPLRTIGRLTYNFLDIDKYSGTNLSEGKTLTLGAGFDTQGTYVAYGTDLYFDYPLFSIGSLTLNTAWSHISGGNDLDESYSFASMIPTQTTQLLELGYYIKSLKLQPWIRYEKQDIDSQSNQIGNMTKSDFDKLYSGKVLGCGINYFFNGYKTNLKLSYVSMKKGVTMTSGEIENKTCGQVWMQLQFCIF